MATKIRLQRQGKKKKALYQMVVTDSRSKRDGKFIEKLGTFNPGVNPPAVVIDFERALYWVKTGAELSDSMRTVLSAQGVLMKKHLDGGVTKGALTQEQADAKFQAWLTGKQGELDKKANSKKAAAEEAKRQKLAAEKASKEAKAAATAAKLAEKAAAEAAAEAPAAEAAAPEAPAAE
ncbi:MAG: 30S ribosomal protein S16 [Flavobacteriales bacterium]